MTLFSEATSVAYTLKSFALRAECESSGSVELQKARCTSNSVKVLLNLKRSSVSQFCRNTPKRTGRSLHWVNLTNSEPRLGRIAAPNHIFQSLLGSVSVQT